MHEGADARKEGNRFGRSYPSVGGLVGPVMTLDEMIEDNRWLMDHLSD